MNRRILLVTVATGLGLIASAPLHAGDPLKIRFGDVGFGFGTPFGVGLQAIADAKGFIAKEFEGEDVTLEWTYFTGTGPAINEAFANDRIDFASYGAVPNIVGAASGLGTVILASTQSTNIFALARPDTGITSLADLKGKRVALQKATIIHWAALQALKDAGVSESDLTIVDLKNADQLSAIAAGSIDAVFGADFLLPLEDKGIARVIFSSARDNPSVSGFGGFLVSTEFRDAYPEATQKVVNGYVRAAAWLAEPENRAEAFEIWSRAGTPVELIERSNANTDYRATLNPRLDGEFERRFQSALAFSAEQRLVRRTPDLTTWADASFLDRALAQDGFAALWPVRQTPVSN